MTWTGHKGGSEALMILFLDLDAGHKVVIILWKLIKLYTYDIFPFLVCILSSNKKLKMKKKTRLGLCVAKGRRDTLTKQQWVTCLLLLDPRAHLVSQEWRKETNIVWRTWTSCPAFRDGLCMLLGSYFFSFFMDLWWLTFALGRFESVCLCVHRNHCATIQNVSSYRII